MKHEPRVLPPRFAPGDRIGGRYRVCDHTNGGIADVYFCEDLESSSPVVLKTPRRFQGYSTRKRAHADERFLDEVRIWAALAPHPNVVTCYYLTIIDDTPYVALEWIADPARRAVTLGAYVATHPGRRLPLREALRIAIHVCHGMSYLAERHPGFVHRDLKPGNILLGADFLPRVTDFGFSQLRTTTSSSIVGTPRYMAPEQHLNGLVDVRADVYAMGCVLFRMLAGHAPFRADDRDGHRELHLSGPIPEIDVDGIPESVRDLVRRCLAKSPDERPSEFASLASELEAIFRAEFDTDPPTVPSVGSFNARDRANRAATYYHLGEFGRAASEYEAALEADADLAHARFGLGLVLEALALHERALDEYARCPLDDAALNRALLLDKLGREREALAELDVLLAPNPGLAPALNARAVIRIRHGDVEAARDDLDAAIQVTGFAPARANRARLHLKAGRLRDALTDIDAVIASGAATADDHRLAAETAIALADARRALREYHAVVDLEGPTPGTLVERARCYARLGRDRRALDDLTLALKLDPRVIEARRVRAPIAFALGRYEQAVEDYALLLDANSEDAAAAYGMGLVLGAIGDFSRAFTLLQHAHELGHPDAEPALRRFGLAPRRQRPLIDSRQPV